MQQRIRAETMVASDPRYAIFLVMGLLMGSLGFFSLVTNLLIPLWEGSFWNGPTFASSSSLSVLVPPMMGGTYLLLAWKFRRINLRRQAAARGNLSVSLAAEQPIPDEAVLPLPCTIMLIPNRRGAVKAGSFFGALLLLGTCWLPFTNPLSDAGVNTIYTVIFSVVILGVAIGLAILITATLIKTGYCQITATEAGLTIQRTKTIFYVPWHEARLFGITRGISRTGPPTSYELSSATTFAAFTRLRRRNVLLPHLKPALPFDEYDRQMEALLALIAARTGLPLYDLR